MSVSKEEKKKYDVDFKKMKSGFDLNLIFFNLN